MPLPMRPRIGSVRVTGAGAAIQYAKVGTGLALNSDQFLVV
jgi:hypothetical protein